MRPRGSREFFRAGYICAALMSAPIWGSASAGAVTVSSADLQSFSQLGSSDPKIQTQNQGPEGALSEHFTTTFGNSFPAPGGGPYGFASAEVGSNSVNIDYNNVVGDTFDLWVANTNENPWDFQLFVDGVGSAVHHIINGTSELLSVALSGGTGVITSVYIQISQDVPVAGTDRTAEYTLSAVPIPPALLLFGSGIIGLGLLTRRRKHKVRPLTVSVG